MSALRVLWNARYSLPDHRLGGQLSVELSCSGSVSVSTVIILWYGLSSPGGGVPFVRCRSTEAVRHCSFEPTLSLRALHPQQTNKPTHPAPRPRGTDLRIQICLPRGACLSPPRDLGSSPPPPV